MIIRAKRSRRKERELARRTDGVPYFVGGRGVIALSDGDTPMRGERRASIDAAGDVTVRADGVIIAQISAAEVRFLAELARRHAPKRR